jgi:hypothetical protein
MAEEERRAAEEAEKKKAETAKQTKIADELAEAVSAFYEGLEALPVTNDETIPASAGREE